MTRLDIWKEISIGECSGTKKHVVEFGIILGYFRCAAVSMENVANKESRSRAMPSPILFSIPGTNLDQ